MDAYIRDVQMNTASNQVLIAAETGKTWADRDAADEGSAFASSYQWFGHICGVWVSIVLH